MGGRQQATADDIYARVLPETACFHGPSVRHIATAGNSRRQRVSLPSTVTPRMTMAKRLTAKSVENIKPGPARREISDNGTGLYLIVQPSGVKSWALRYRFRRKSIKL